MSRRQRIDFVSEPVGPLAGSVRVPGDKSISHRALMLGAIADGVTRIHGFLNSADTRCTWQAFERMGVGIEQRGPDAIHVHGAGLHGLTAPDVTLDLGNSGTSVRLLAGLLAGQTFDSELVGDESLMTRPMRRIVEPLRLMHAGIRCSEDGTLPLVIHGGRRLTGIEYAMPVASAQLKSAILLAGLYAAGKTVVTEPAMSRDHTERMLELFGCPLQRRGAAVAIRSAALKAQAVHVPGDISSAAFLMVAACAVPGSDILLENVGINPTRHAVIAILQQMGADIEVQERQDGQTEPVADIRIRQRPLHGIDIPPDTVPIAIDEFPVIFIAAACARGETRLTGAAELRVKESDRIAGMAEGLAALGIEVETRADGMRVTGGRLSGGSVASHSDHRLAMAFAVAGAVADGPVRIRDCTHVNTSFPGFVDCVRSVGMRVQAGDGHD